MRQISADKNKKQAGSESNARDCPFLQRKTKKSAQIRKIRFYPRPIFKFFGYTLGSYVKKISKNKQA